MDSNPETQSKGKERGGRGREWGAQHWGKPNSSSQTVQYRKSSQTEQNSSQLPNVTQTEEKLMEKKMQEQQSLPYLSKKNENNEIDSMEKNEIDSMEKNEKNEINSMENNERDSMEENEKNEIDSMEMEEERKVMGSKKKERKAGRKKKTELGAQIERKALDDYALQPENHKDLVCFCDDELVVQNQMKSNKLLRLIDCFFEDYSR